MTTVPQIGVGSLFANRYEILAPLGSGGQAGVWQARDIHEDTEVALKLIHPQVALNQINTQGHVWAEAQILRRLSDPHILPIRNADTFLGQSYLVTDVARHGTLEGALGRTGSCGLTVDQVVRYIRQSCSGIGRAHADRLVHNDIKPGNLFLNSEDECMVGDFGLASYVSTAAGTVIPAGFTCETVAPEIAAAFGTTIAAASFKSDVYSLGATAYWLLCAQAPLTAVGGRLPTLQATMAKIASMTPPRLHDLAPHVPHYVAAAIEAAMEPDPADRITVSQFGARLGQRPRVARRWFRTDAHQGHLSCWRGEPQSGSTYVLCVEPGPRANQVEVTTRHESSNRKISAGCKTVATSKTSQTVRGIIRRLG